MPLPECYQREQNSGDYDPTQADYKVLHEMILKGTARNVEHTTWTWRTQ